MDVVWLRILDGRSDQSDQGHQDQQSTDERWKDCLKCPPPGPHLVRRATVPQRRHLCHWRHLPRNSSFVEFYTRGIIWSRGEAWIWMVRQFVRISNTIEPSPELFVQILDKRPARDPSFAVMHEG